MSDIDEYVTITQAAEQVGYSRVWIRTLAARGKIPSARKARLILVHLPSLVAYREQMDAQCARPAPPQPQEQLTEDEWRALQWRPTEHKEEQGNG